MNNLIDEVLGPQVAIIDNNENEIQSIRVMLNELEIGNKFFEVDYTEPDFPTKPLNTVKLVFLDLYYSDVSSDWDPYACTDWLKAVVPKDAKYILVVWSNDGYRTEELIDVMKETETPLPYFVETSPKSKYQDGDNTYDIERLLADLNTDLEKNVKIISNEYYGQIIAVEKENVLINCLMHENPPVFEVRRFDLKPFKGYFEPQKGMFLRIKITNKPGSKIFDFALEPSDLSGLFIKADDFEDIGDISFLSDESAEDDENNL